MTDPILATDEFTSFLFTYAALVVAILVGMVKVWTARGGYRLSKPEVFGVSLLISIAIGVGAGTALWEVSLRDSLSASLKLWLITNGGYTVVSNLAKTINPVRTAPSRKTGEPAEQPGADV